MESKIISGFKDYTINPSGVVIHTKTNKVIKPRIDGNYIRIRLRDDKGCLKDKSLSSLIASAFIPNPNKHKLLDYHDFDTTNISIDNLFWSSHRDIQLRARENRIKEFNKKYGIVNTANLENLPLIECQSKKGYYHIPFTTSPVVINKSGDMFNLETGNEHITNLTKKKYLQCSLNINNKPTLIRVHRIVGLLFVKKPQRHVDIPFSDLQVNHKDGNKLNNNYKNLEWVTNAENQKHARENELFSKSIPILSKCIKSGEIKRFISISDLSRYVGISHHVITTHVTGDSSGLIDYNGYFIKLDDGSDWPDLVEYHKNPSRTVAEYDIIAINHEQRRSVLLSSIAHACYFLGVSEHVYHNKKSDNTDVVINGWVLKKYTDYKKEIRT
jgi:hypothetical protein